MIQYRFIHDIVLTPTFERITKFRRYTNHIFQLHVHVYRIPNATDCIALNLRNKLLELSDVWTSGLIQCME